MYAFTQTRNRPTHKPYLPRTKVGRHNSVLPSADRGTPPPLREPPPPPCILTLYRSLRVPNGSVSAVPLARAYTTERWAREKGTLSLSDSIKYCRISGRIDSKRNLVVIVGTSVVAIVEAVVGAEVVVVVVVEKDKEGRRGGTAGGGGATRAWFTAVRTTRIMWRATKMREGGRLPLWTPPDNTMKHETPRPSHKNGHQHKQMTTRTGSIVRQEEDTLTREARTIRAWHKSARLKPGRSRISISSHAT